MEVCIIGPNLRDQSKGSFHVHRNGCMDIKRNPNYRWEDVDWIIDCDTIEEVVVAVYDDIMQEDSESTWDDYENDFHFCPCCKGLTRSA